MNNQQKALAIIKALIGTLKVHNAINDQEVIELNKLAQQLFEQQPQQETLELQTYISNLENLISPDNIMAKNIIENIYAFHPGVVISLLSKMMAIQLDQKYPDHILNTSELYCISLVDGRIQKLYTPQIKNHNCIALFRTLDDAKLACHALAPILKSLYGKQKDKKH